MNIRATIMGVMAALSIVYDGKAEEHLIAKSLSVGRPCSMGDVIGLWETVDVKATQPSDTRHYSTFQKDYLRFSADGEFIYFGATEPVKDVSVVNATLDRMDRADGVTYKVTFQPNHALVILRDGKFFQGFTCTITGPARGKYGSEAMVWTELEGFPAVRRVQVRRR